MFYPSFPFLITSTPSRLATQRTSSVWGRKTGRHEPIRLVCQPRSPGFLTDPSREQVRRSHSRHIAANRPAKISWSPATDSGIDAEQLTQQFWGLRGFELTGNENREAIENITGFFQLLDRWDRQSQNS